MTSRTPLREGGVARAWRRLRLCAIIASSIVFNSYRFSTLQTASCSRIAFDAAYKATFTLRTTSCVPARALPRTQLVDVKCMVPPAQEHSQTALLTSESIRGTWHCPAEVLVRVWHIHPSHLDNAARREPRGVEVEFVDFDDKKKYVIE